MTSVGRPCTFDSVRVLEPDDSTLLRMCCAAKWSDERGVSLCSRFFVLSPLPLHSCSSNLLTSIKHLTFRIYVDKNLCAHFFYSPFIANNIPTICDQWKLEGTFILNFVMIYTYMLFGEQGGSRHKTKKVSSYFPVHYYLFKVQRQKAGVLQKKTYFPAIVIYSI